MKDSGGIRDPHQPLIEKKHQWFIWLIPLIALSITAWMGWEAWENRGINITVYFSDGDGIVAGKTLVRYNGLQVGTVESVHLTSNLKSVVTEVNVRRELEDWLTDKTSFWLVKPEISMAGVTGIEALMSGNYITFNPERGNRTLSFEALNEAPPLATSKPGLHLTLKASDAGSLMAGSPVYSREIKVGEIEQVHLAKDGQSVAVHVYIEPEYTQLVKTNTRFWNVSGLDISGPLSQLKVHMASVVSLVKGGIAFSTPDWESSTQSAINSTSYTLYKDYAAAKTGIPIDIEFPLGTEIVPVGGRVLFYGVEVGVVRDYKISKDMQSFVVTAAINPMADKVLVDGARFWLVETKVTPKGIQGLNALFEGPYIAMDISETAINAAKKKSRFQGYLSKPPASPNAPGLHMKLITDDASGISAGSGVWMHGVQIGSIESVRLKPGHVEIAVLIQRRYQSLIRKGSKCWNTSGVKVSAGLNGIELRTRPFESMLAGGITCETGNENLPAAENGQRVKLYASRDEAFVSGKVFFLTAQNAPSLVTGAPVYYHGVEVGVIEKMGLDDPASQVLIQLRIKPSYESLVTSASQFWNVSGFDARFSLWDGVKIKSESLESLAFGGVAFATPAQALAAPADMRFPLHNGPKAEWLGWNPDIYLTE
ncbi:intermembrane transport protein PqiB [Parendozoicomonas haliclonae]|uniref:Paraquat-inducible protein B n=1 Tax=Parendozoicomonas haliclonae TaxID=1960125 RepID=A0A1X7AJL2_9GAMM|nr:MlaD family protein [Parendozoicomonas haliclonae]SMA46683.1 Paraquat-inducible protein B [Parendozoicomonas haliclonae]